MAAFWAARVGYARWKVIRVARFSRRWRLWVSEGVIGAEEALRARAESSVLIRSRRICFLRVLRGIVSEGLPSEAPGRDGSEACSVVVNDSVVSSAACASP